MTGVRAMLLVMGRVRLDAETADRMLAGRVDPADAPPGFEAVGELLEAARAVARRPVLAAVAVHPQIHPGAVGNPTPRATQRLSMRVTAPRLRLSALAAVAALSAMTGAAYAAGLPAAVSSTTSAVLQRLGITNPAPNSHAHTPPAGTHGSRVSTPAKTTAAGAARGAVISSPAGDRKPTTGGKGHTDASGHGKGTEISTLAHTTTATGRDKGAVISTAANGGKRHAGRHGGGASAHGSGKAPGPGHSHSRAGAGHSSGS